MNCVIDNSILYYLKKGKKVDVIRRYLRKKYRIDMDISVLKERIKNLNLSLRPDLLA